LAPGTKVTESQTEVEAVEAFIEEWIPMADLATLLDFDFFTWDLAFEDCKSSINEEALCSMTLKAFWQALTDAETREFDCFDLQTSIDFATWIGF
jgi:hypothetical protein